MAAEYLLFSLKLNVILHFPKQIHLIDKITLYDLFKYFHLTDVFCSQIFLANLKGKLYTNQSVDWSARDTDV